MIFFFFFGCDLMVDSAVVGSDGDGRIGDGGFRWSACGQLPMGGSALIYAHEHAINNKCRPTLLISQKISASLQQSSTIGPSITSPHPEGPEPSCWPEATANTLWVWTCLLLGQSASSSTPLKNTHLFFSRVELACCCWWWFSVAETHFVANPPPYH